MFRRPDELSTAEPMRDLGYAPQVYYHCRYISEPSSILSLNIDKWIDR